VKIQKPNPGIPRSLSDYPEEMLERMYERMFLIRIFELAVNHLFLQGKMPGTIHLCHGQEATAVGACMALEPTDYITMTHRPHGQALAKGVTPRQMMAELYGKETGCCKGKGGSMHVGDISKGAMPAIAIVGASSPIAAGVAFGFKQRKTGQVICNMFGEGTVNKGDWHEAMNLAAVWKLPVIFFCENNLWGVSTHMSDVMLNEYVAERAEAYGMPGVTVYGNDPIEVYHAVQDAAKRAREGGGPTLVEALTYRRGGHKRDDPATYRPREEVDAWLEKDPVPMFRSRLGQLPAFTEDRIVSLESAAGASIADAVEFAHSSPFPPVSMALEHVYA
jgi:TPP-dependent pyruvate/acetoin dehydrogenase alpha subunit